MEDEKTLADSLCLLLQAKGFETEAVNDGISGADYAETGIYDLLILDIMMPGLNGYEVARSVRRNRCSVPILMLSALSDTDARVKGLNSGADYYLTKPFDSGELIACINALLRRQGNQVEELSLGNTRLGLSTSLLIADDKTVRLSAKEFDIMRILFSAGGSIVPKETILAKVWSFDSEAVENNVEVYIGFLRKKLISIGSNVRIIALRKQGYLLEVIAT